MEIVPFPASDADVRLARHALIESGLRTTVPAPLPVRDEIERSWRRSIGQGAASGGRPFRYINAVDPQSGFLRAARPVLDRWEQRLDDMRVTLFLSDRSGQIVDRRVDDVSDRGKFDSAAAAEGFDFSEVTIGTNALGTVMEARRAMFVRGSEHFNEALETFACAGAPVRHPFTGRPVGSLALASMVDAAHPLMLAMAREAAQQIERNLARTVGSREIALTMSYLRHRDSRHPVVVLDRDVVLANVTGLSFVSGEAHTLLWEVLHAQDFSSGPQVLDLDFPLVKGQVLARRIEDLGDGPAFVVEFLSGDRRVPGARCTEAVPAGTPLTTWDAALHAEIGRAAGCSGTVALTGPGGVGKLHAARAWLRGHDPAGEPFVVDAALMTAGAAQPWVGDAVEAVGQGRSVVVRHLENLPEEEVNRVKALAGLVCGEGEAPGPRLVLTLDAEACPPVVAELVAQIAEAVEIPALANARERMPELVRSILDSLGPDAGCTLSSAALQTFLRWNWPGNVAELRRTLRKLAHDRPGQVIQQEHLPAHLRAAVQRRLLTRIESVERDAIVAALAQEGGNRSHAADRLGIGRTTLYRKMRALGIETPERMAP